MLKEPFGIIAFAVGLAAAGLTSVGCSTTRVETFETPEKAMATLGEVTASDDRARAEAMFGADGAEALRSGDEAADCDGALRFTEMLRLKLAFEDLGEVRKVALVGDEGWPFPIPLLREGDRWRFDLDDGIEEILSRRIGRNEILTIATLRAYAEAQGEYFSRGRDGNPPAYARKFAGGPGRHDGLYWPAADGEVESPIGPLAAKAEVQNLAMKEDQGAPYHGYRFRILTGQGKSAPGGERSYLDDKGLMTGGFAAVAWPAKYGNAGIMTFLVGGQGIVFQKDLGEKTEEVAAGITAYDPDGTWDPVGN